MTIEDQLRDTIKEKYGSITNFSKSIGIPSTSIYSILQRGIANAGIAMVIKIFDAVGLDASSIDTGHLEEKKAAREHVSGEEFEIVKKFRTLDAYGKETVSIILDREYTRAGAAISQQKPAPAAKAQRATLTIDYYRLPVSAGTGTVDPGDGYHDTLEVLANRYTVASDYVVRVQGDSMMPRFLDGDLLLVHKTDVVDFGEVGVFSVDGKSFIKQAGCGELISLNREYPPIPLTSAAVYPQGRIIGVLDPAWIVH